MLRRKVLRLATALGFVISSVASAQDATTPPPAAPPAPVPSDIAVGQPAAAPAGKAEEKTEEIVVTGTRIRRKDLSTPAPVTVLSSQELTSSGKVSVGDFLQTLPEQGNAINTNYNNGGTGETQVSLRSLGAQRTLVLVNGRRFVAGGVAAGSVVDLNSIPTAAIERIEVLKDGASAVYGSDAIAGVVNIITKKKMNGTEASGYAGTTGHGDGSIYDLALTTGTSSDKGNILFSAGWTKTNSIMAGDRSWAQYAIDYVYQNPNYLYGTTGEHHGGSSAVPGGRFSLNGYVLDPSTGGVCQSDVDAAANNIFQCKAGGLTQAAGSLAQRLLSSTYDATAGNPGGELNPDNYLGFNFTYDPSATGNIDGYRRYKSSDAYNYQAVNYLVTPQQRVQLFSTGDVNLGDVARGYFEASYVDRTSRTQIAPDPLNIGLYGLTLDPLSIYNPTATVTNGAVTTAGLPLTDVRRRLLEFGPRANDYDVTTFRTVLGFDGTLPDSAGFLKGWFWDANFNWGRTSGTNTNEGALRLPYIQDAMGPSIVDPRADSPTHGQPICVKDPTNPATQIAGCVPLNALWVGGGTPAPGNLAYTGTDRGLNEMQQLAVNVTGELFKIAERPVSIALGGDYTEYKASLVVNAINQAGEGDNYNSSSVSGSYNTTQGYAELQIPLLSNMPLAQELEVDLALRASDYSTFGSNTSYKAGVRYSPIRDVTLRGTFSTAFRAPSITDLYSGATESFPSVADPCAGGYTPGSVIATNCQRTGQDLPQGNGDQSGQVKELIGGNPKVQPETADIFTLGVVLEPQMVRNLSVTVDYFNTKISDTIGQIGAANILSGCIARGYGPYCDAIHRDPVTRLITSIDDFVTNYSKLDVQGVDMGLRYALPTTFGKFGFVFNGSYLIKYDQNLPSGQKIEGKGTYDVGTNPSFKALAALTYGLGNLGVGWTTRYIGSFKECSNNNPSDLYWNTGTGGLCYTGTSDFTNIGFTQQYTRTVSAYYLHDLNLSYALKSSAGKTNIALGIQNLFDGRPPRVYSSFLTYADYDYQFPGRTFFARVTQNF